ncbi:unnamed protein product [Triticum turgidum subsp. durum]|uniref:Aminotransferase-like plant mobile domain-containing protein n=1 Tax=Triticum turgidum subsp. durum TaxID=4567 RepID=A0A9R0TJN9_TRITD|nr:unnamed protein product [Triticum turgidum subsp. durum]
MAHGQPLVSSYQLTISKLAKQQLCEPATHELANPVLVHSTLSRGTLDSSLRGWHSEHSFHALCYHPMAPIPRSDLDFTLGTRIVSQKLGWEYHEIQYVKRPKGYTQWGVEVLNNHYFNLQGGEENTDYIRGTIYCSLCDYSVSPSLLHSLLERWSPQTNTFMLLCGERTITLLDMLLMAGLPIVGEPYEEYIPSLTKLNPSLLLYPNFLFDLLDMWEVLSTESKHKEKFGTFQAWCDYFHNKRADFSPSASLRKSRMYVAAFVALWLCCVVVVGEGPFIRLGVLVMASWIALGRKISLAPPALSSLYLALRRISTNPVGPSFEQTPLSIHYIIGWMHLYLKKAFGAKGKGEKLPSPKRLPMQLAMLSTMFRPPKVFSPETA